jgi:predicted permease
MTGEWRATLRTLRHQPVFTGTVVLSLALAISVNTAMYGMLDALMHPRLDMKNPQALYRIHFYGDQRNVVGNRGRDEAISSGLTGIESLTWDEPVQSTGRPIERGEASAEGAVAAVAPNYFDVLQPRVIAGRTFRTADVGAPDQPAVVSEVLAGQLFRPGESPVGQRITFDRAAYTVIGVVSGASNLPNQSRRLWLLAPNSNEYMYERLVRLRPGASLPQAERELAAVSSRIAAVAGEAPSEVAFRIHAAADPQFQVGALRFALLYAVGALLLIACANVANLQIARGYTRRRELSVRAALGASRHRLVTHLLRESALLAAGGLMLGLFLTYVAGRIMTAEVPPSMAGYIMVPSISWRVLCIAVIAGMLCLLLGGVGPAFVAARADPSDALKAGAGTGATRASRRKYSMLVGFEIALALALTSGSVLTVRAAMRAGQAGTGFDPRPLATGQVIRTGPVPASYHYSAFLQSVVSRVRAIDGVTDASASVERMVQGDALTVEDPGGVRELPAPRYSVAVVTPSYVRTRRQPIVRGRDFLEGERDRGVAIVDEMTARVLWPNANPVGAQIKFGASKSNAPFVTVVGVVGEQDGFRTDPSVRFMLRGVYRLGRIYYLPGPGDTLDTHAPPPVATVTARTNGRAERLAVNVNRALAGAADFRTTGISTMDAFVGVIRARELARLVSGLFTLFAAIGLGLATFGVYGIVAHSVAERRRELGVRIALGAQAADVLHAVLRESVVVVLLGIAIGLLCTKYGVRILGPLALEDDFFNAGLFALVALALAATAGLAAIAPALRAVRIDPIESLRND